MAYNVGTHPRTHNSIHQGVLSNTFPSTPGLFGNPTSNSSASANYGSFQYYLNLDVCPGQRYTYSMSPQHQPRNVLPANTFAGTPIARTPVVPTLPEDARSPSPTTDDVEDEEGNLILSSLPNSCDDLTWKVKETHKKMLRYQQQNSTSQASPRMPSRGSGSCSSEPMEVVNLEDLEVQRINESFEEQQKQRAIYESDDLMSLFYSASEDGSPSQKTHIISPPEFGEFAELSPYGAKLSKHPIAPILQKLPPTAPSRNKLVEFDLGPKETSSPQDNIAKLGDSIVNHLLSDSPARNFSSNGMSSFVPSSSRCRDEDAQGSVGTVVQEDERLDSWETAGDDELTAKLEEMKLTVNVKKRQESQDLYWNPFVLDHVLEVFDMPPSKSAHDIQAGLYELGYGHARLVKISKELFMVSFSTALEAHQASIVKHDWIRLRPLRYSGKSVQRSALLHEDSLRPSKLPHKNYVGVARRMVEYALCKKANIPVEQRKAEDATLKDLRAAKKSIAKEFD